MPPCNVCQNPTLCTERCHAYAEQLAACAASGQMTAAEVSAHVEAGEMPAQTRSQKLTATGFTRRPTWRSLPSDDDVEAGGMPASCEWCTDPDGVACFPQYGVGPHTCFFRIPGATFGQSKPLPREDWPSNYREDPESPGMGVYWCPHCGSGKPGEAGEMEAAKGDERG